jgi:sigma-E factor negative regulatory protein RseA
MTDPVKEQLSACLDGELPERELDLLLKRLAQDPQMRQTMGAYARVGEAMRAERSLTTASTRFAARVSAAIAAEPTIPAAVSTRQFSSRQFTPGVMRWLKPASGIAIAAGVAAIAVITLQPSAPQTQLVADGASTAAAVLAAESADQSSSSYTVPTVTGSNSLVPPARLTNYVVAHSEYSSPLGRRTVLISGVLSDDEFEDAGVAQHADPSAP